MKKRFEEKRIYIYLAFYLLLNILFLTKFPFMHSDETWLSGLSRAMMTEGLGTTEPFFDLLERYPHAIKSIFHVMQMPLIKIFGYNLFAVRFLSLIFGIFTLIFFNKLLKKILGSETKAFILTILLSLDIQFIYSSHFARQDIIIAFLIVLVLYYIIKNEEDWSFRKDIFTGIIIGLSIGIHPNSLMVAFAAGGLYLYYIVEKRFRIRNLLFLILTVSVFAGIFIAISYSFNDTFFSDYLKYGSDLGVKNAFFEKFEALPKYFQKLYLGITGTYYIPNMKFQLILFGFGIVASIIYAFKNREVLKFLLPILGILAAFVLIGRYSQPSVILLLPVMYLLIFYMLSKLLKKRIFILTSLIGVVLTFVSIFSVVPYINDDYKAYEKEIVRHIPQGSKTLANLNAEFFFEEGDLLDYRNLDYLYEREISFSEYITERKIEYIVYPEEMDFIYERRPVWNIVYGNLYPYYEDMNDFFFSDCTLIHEFTSPYAMRISRFSEEKDWSVKIYKVGGQADE